jgi:C4-dicarboxylate transporter DctM subunit
MEIAPVRPAIERNLSVLASISDAPLGGVIRGVLPFMLLLLFVLGITTYLPELSLWPPRQIYGHHPISIGTTPTNHKAT